MPSETAPTTQINGQSPLSPAVNAWRIILNDQGRSIHTIKAFAADINLLAEFLPLDVPVGSITTRDLNNFLDWMQRERGVPCSPKTLARRITSIKSFFRWLQHSGVILIDPAEKVMQKSVISPLPAMLNPDELHMALKVADSYRHGDKPDARPYTLLKLLLDTAIKKGECLTLATNHIDLDTPNGPILFVRYASPQHRYKERKIALTDEWIEAYQEYQQQYDLSEGLFPWSPRRLEYLLEDIGKEAGIEQQLSFLMCRWTSALVDYTDGVDPNKIRQKLGISKIQWREVFMKIKRLAKGDDDGDYMEEDEEE
jgi:site-specific recombinase XerD